MYSDLTSAYDAEGRNREAPGTVWIEEHNMVAKQRFDEEQEQAWSKIGEPQDMGPERYKANGARYEEQGYEDQEDKMQEEDWEIAEDERGRWEQEWQDQLQEASSRQSYDDGGMRKLRQQKIQEHNEAFEAGDQCRYAGVTRQLDDWNEEYKCSQQVKNAVALEVEKAVKVVRAEAEASMAETVAEAVVSSPFPINGAKAQRASGHFNVVLHAQVKPTWLY